MRCPPAHPGPAGSPLTWLCLVLRRVLSEAAELLVTALGVERGLLSAVVQMQVSHGYELAGSTSFRSNNPVYVVVGRRDAEGL